MGKREIAKIFKPPVIDFIAQASEIPNLVCAILFGSVVTGDISKKSDIDILLLFDCAHNPELGEEMKIAIQIAGEICAKHNLAHTFSFVIQNKRKMTEIDTDFLWKVCQEGIIIWGLPEIVLARKPNPNLTPLSLISYSVSELPNKNKRAVFRALYGNGKNKKGLIDKKNERLGRGTLIIGSDKFDDIKSIFDRFGVKIFSVKKLWGYHLVSGLSP